MNYDLNLELVLVIRFKFQRRSFIKGVLAVVKSITNCLCHSIGTE